MFKQMMNHVAITVPLEASMLQSFIRPKVPELSDVDVKITNGQVILSGSKKVGFAFLSKEVRFKLTLEPREVQGRKITFNVVKVEPKQNELLNGKFLSHPPYIIYDKQTLTLDLSAIGPLQKVKVGNIKSLTLAEGRAILIIGA